LEYVVSAMTDLLEAQSKALSDILAGSSDAAAIIRALPARESQ